MQNTREYLTKLGFTSDRRLTAQSNSIRTNINLIPISPEQSRQRHRLLSKEETTLLRGALGKLNWGAGMTRPEISFDVCVISTKICNHL